MSKKLCAPSKLTSPSNTGSLALLIVATNATVFPEEFVPNPTTVHPSAEIARAWSSDVQLDKSSPCSSSTSESDRQQTDKRVDVDHIDLTVTVDVRFTLVGTA